MEQKTLQNKETMAQVREDIITQIKNVEYNCRIRCEIIQQETVEKIQKLQDIMGNQVKKTMTENVRNLETQVNTSKEK